MRNRTLSQPRVYLLIAIIFITAIVLAACNGASKLAPYSNQPTATSSICLVGIWGIKNPEIYFKYSLPAGSFDLTTLAFKKSAGGIAYRFDSKGVLTVEAVTFDGRFDVKQGAEVLPLEMKMEGFASGAYTINGDTVVIDKVISTDVQFTAVYARESMMDTKNVENFAPLFQVPYTSAKFECTADTLTLLIENFPGIQEKIEFQRLTK